MIPASSSNSWQAQPSKARIYGQDETKYQQKLKLKAEIIVGAANRLYGMRGSNIHVDEICEYVADEAQVFNNKSISKWISEKSD